MWRDEGLLVEYILVFIVKPSRRCVIIASRMIRSLCLLSSSLIDF
jgi:hypothetical protein